MRTLNIPNHKIVQVVGPLRNKLEAEMESEREDGREEGWDSGYWTGYVAGDALDRQPASVPSLPNPFVLLINLIF